MKPHLRLRLVRSPRPLGPLTRAEKLAVAIKFLRERGLYVLDIGARRPKWGTPNELPKEDTRLLKALTEADRRRKA